MLRIEMTEAQTKVAAWVIERVRLNFLDYIEQGLPDWLSELPVIQGRTLLLPDEVNGEGSTADEFCHVLDFDFAHKGHLDFGMDPKGIYDQAGIDLYEAIEAAERDIAQQVLGIAPPPSPSRLLCLLLIERDKFHHFSMAARRVCGGYAYVQVGSRSKEVCTMDVAPESTLSPNGTPINSPLAEVPPGHLLLQDVWLMLHMRDSGNPAEPCSAETKAERWRGETCGGFVLRKWMKKMIEWRLGWRDLGQELQYLLIYLYLL